MEVSDKVKAQFHRDSVHKKITLNFPDIGVTITNSNINAESLELRESILENNSIEFVGCIASMFSIQLQEVYQDIKGQRIEVSICTDDTEDEPIPLFHGIVDSAVLQSNKKSKKITAYDQLYTRGNMEVSGWYNGLSFPVTLKGLRDSLFNYLGIEQAVADLPNDAIMIKKQYDPKNLKALNVIKAICQINGAFGIINRQNKFEYLILKNVNDASELPYPSGTLFPDSTLFPSSALSGKTAGEAAPGEILGFYRNVNYEEFEVKPVDKLTIRQSEEDAGVSFGNGANNYIVQGNMFTYGKEKNELLAIAERVYENVNGLFYHPFKADNNGLPFIECGRDTVSYLMYEEKRTAKGTEQKQVFRNFYVFSRELTGVQALRDSYGADGEEYQTEFITDLQTQIDTIKMNVKEEVNSVIRDHNFTEEFQDYTYDKGYLDEQFNGQLKVESVAELPASPDPNTIYLIQGKVSVT